VDVNLSARLPNGLVLRGGTSVGRTVQDNCEIVAVSPEIVSGVEVASGTATVPRSSAQVTGTPYCHQAARVQPSVTALQLRGDERRRRAGAGPRPHRRC
jgi:hypothetical protein